MMSTFNPFTGKLQRLQEVGGKPGIASYNSNGYTHEDFTLVPGVDPIYQHPLLYPDDIDIVITLDTANAKNGDRFIIKHDANGNCDHCLIIKEGETIIDKIYARVIKEFIFDGTEWTGADLGTHPRDNYQGIGIGKYANPQESAVAIGYIADGHLDGVAIGAGAKGYDYGVGIGFDAYGYDYGVAVGESTHGYTNGIAIGYRSNSNQLRSIAIGFRSKNTRDAELAINIGDEVEGDRSNRYHQAIIGSWIRKTTNATPTTMRVDGNASSRFTIRPQSALTFKIMVTARDNTTGDCAAYLFDGLIKRDSANNTTLCICNKTVLHEDDATWDCDVAADDTNEALQITVTGDAENIVRWSARLDGVETSFLTA